MINKDVKVKRHPKYTNLILFSYGLTADMSDILVRQSRGIVFDESSNFEIVTYPFNKFFNYGESNAVDIDWSTAKVFKKLDGSMIQMYFYNGEWNFGTTGTIDGKAPVYDNPIDFCDLARKVFEESGYIYPEMGFTYLFELTSPLNRVVVEYPDRKLTLLGVRNLNTMEEVSYDELHEIASKYKFNLVETLDLKSIDEVVKRAEEINPHEEEGFIVCDAKHNRIKIKSSEYVKIHRSICNLSIRSLLQVCVDGEASEFLSYFPELTENLTPINELYNNYILEIDRKYSEVPYFELRKDFAKHLKKNNISGIEELIFFRKRYGHELGVEEEFLNTRELLKNNILFSSIWEVLGDKVKDVKINRL